MNSRCNMRFGLIYAIYGILVLASLDENIQE